MADWLPVLRKILRHEGVTLDEAGQPVPGRTGLVDHPDDPGGETNYGITRAEATANGWPGPMSELPFDLVQRIYRGRYWDAIRGDEIPDQAIAEEMADTAVNCGVETVVRFLQDTLNACNRKATRWPDRVVDGVMGPLTIETLRTALTVHPRLRLVILRTIDSLQNVRYLELCKQPPPRGDRFESFFEGWVLNRCGVVD